MSGLDIANKVRNGLRKATNATGSGEHVYVIKRTTTGGCGPALPGNTTEEEFLLKDAIFKTINKTLINDDSIRSGDRELVVNADIVINQNDVIRQGSKRFLVVAVDTKEPSGVLLSQIIQVR